MRRSRGLKKSESGDGDEGKIKGYPNAGKGCEGFRDLGCFGVMILMI